MDFSLVLKGNIFYDLLFFNSPKIHDVAKQIIEISKLFVGVVFVASAIWEFFTENRYRELILRTLLCLIIFSTYEKFLAESIKASFVVSEKILIKNNKDNYLLNSFKRAKKVIKKDTTKTIKKKPQISDMWNILLVMNKVPVSDVVSVVIWILVYIIFVFLKILYTTTFYLLYVFISLQALFFIFSPTSATLKGALRTYLSLLITPLVITVILIILDNSMDQYTTGENTFSESLKGLIQLLISGILLCFAPNFAASLLDGRGNIMVAGKIVQVVSAAIMTMGLRGIVSRVLGTPRMLLDNGFKNIKNIVRSKDKKNLSSLKNKSRLKDIQSKGEIDSSSKKTRLNSSQPQKKGHTNPIQTEKRNKKLEKRAQKLIRKSHKKNINLNSFSSQEKSKAIELARSNPRANFIRKGIYFRILSELNSPPQQEESTSQKRRIRIKRNITRRRPSEAIKKNQGKSHGKNKKN